MSERREFLKLLAATPAGAALIPLLAETGPGTLAADVECAAGDVLVLSGSRYRTINGHTLSLSTRLSLGRSRVEDLPDADLRLLDGTTTAWSASLTAECSWPAASAPGCGR